MKFLPYAFCAVVLLVAPAHAEEAKPRSIAKEAWISGGYNEAASIAFGARYGLFGFEIGARDTGDEIPDGTVDAPIPHSNFTDAGTRNDGNAFGMDLLLFLDLNDRFALYGGGGGYWQERVTLVQSNATGLFWINDRDDEFEWAYSGGVRARVSEKITAGVGYHSVRGVNAQVGIRF